METRKLLVLALPLLAAADTVRQDSLDHSLGLSSSGPSDTKRFSATDAASPENTVWIVSNRRSGTHLAMDLLAAVLPAPYTLVKTNHVVLDTSLPNPPYASFADSMSCACFWQLRRRGYVVHAHRDIRDVLVSSYFYQNNFPSEVSKRNMTLDRFLQNEAGARDKIIEQWVNTTSPLFYEPNVFQLKYTDSVTTLPHTIDALARYLGKEPVAYPPGTKMLRSPSHAVALGSGGGEHGYTTVISDDLQNEILLYTQKKELEWKLGYAGTCSSRQSSLSRLSRNRSGDSGTFPVGNEKYRIRLPKYCPSAISQATVVQRETSHDK